MSELLQQLESATGPSRELDASIFSFLKNSLPHEIELIPHYTKSMDDALTLVDERKFWWRIQRRKNMPQGSVPNPTGIKLYIAHLGLHAIRSKRTSLGGAWGDANFPAIALCIASIKAMSRSTPEPDAEA